MKATDSIPALHPAEDYEFLREAGLAHIQQLSSKLWTDYNVHDPGITMLEVLAFAVADLGFRAGHPIGDILAPEDEAERNIQQFFTLAQVAPTRPWSVQDYRKLLMDLPDVANAWLTRASKQEVDIYLDRTDREFITSTTPGNWGEKIMLNGLYEVAIRFEEDAVYGDLSDNSIRFWDTIVVPGRSEAVSMEIEVEFPFQSRLPARLQQITEADVDSGFFDFGDRGVLGGEHLGWYCTFKLGVRPEEVFPDEVDRELVTEVRFLHPQPMPLSTSELVAATVNNLAWWKAKLKQHYLPRRDHIREKLAIIRNTLLQHRNLCEDFYAVVPMDLQEIAIEVDIEVAAGTDLQATEVAIYRAVQDYLDPPMRFYTLSEMLDKGYGTDAIFDGPLLANGFLDPAELAAHDRRAAVYGSDLVQLVMGIAGVTAVRSLRMTNRIAADPVAEAVTDCLRLTEPGRFQPTVDARRSQLRFFQRGRPPVTHPKREVLEQYRAGLLQRVTHRGLASTHDLPVPYGKPRAIGGYASVQEDFPLAWGISSAGLPADATADRKSKAQQLKAYLAHFEQVLVQYVAQLQHVKRLLAVGEAPVSLTYARRVATEIPGWEALVRDQETFDTSLAGLTEDTRVRRERQGRLLDHLLARFNVSLVEMATLSWQERLVEDADHWVQAKARFLRNFPRWGMHRAGAMDYGQLSLHCSPLSGFQQRVCGLLGWNVPDAFRLRKGQGEETGTYQLEVVDEDGTVLLTTVAWNWTQEPFHMVDTLVELALQPEQFLVAQRRLELYAEGGEKVGSSGVFATEEAALSAQQRLILMAGQFKFAAQVHLVEHILLRPRVGQAGEHDLLHARLSSLSSFDVPDPWSCRLSLVLPHALPHRELSHAEWRRLVQRLVREELPAHLYVEFLWVDAAQYSAFREAYRDWRAALYHMTRGAGLPKVPAKMEGEVSLPEPGFPEGKSESKTEFTAEMALPGTLNGLRNLFGAECVVFPAKRTTEYADGEHLAEVYDPDGPIVKAWVSKYSEGRQAHALPGTSGIFLDRSTGRIHVGEAATLRAADAIAFSFYTLNQAGGITYHRMGLTVLEDDGPQLVCAAGKYDFEYVAHEKVAWVDARGWGIAGVSWPRGVVPYSFLALDSFTGDITVSNPAALFKAVRSGTGAIFTLELAVQVKNHEGLVHTVKGKVQVKQSHDAVAIPHPGMAVLRPFSYYKSPEAYLHEIMDDLDGGIVEVEDVLPDYGLAAWGLRMEGVDRPQRARIILHDHLAFVQTVIRLGFEQDHRTGVVWTTFDCMAVDGIGQRQPLRLRFIFGPESTGDIPAEVDPGGGGGENPGGGEINGEVDPGGGGEGDSPASWKPAIVSGRLDAYGVGALVGVLSDSKDEGILATPVVIKLPPYVTWADSGLVFETATGTTPQQELKVLDSGKFTDYVRAHCPLNPAKTLRSCTFQVESTDVKGGISSTDVPLKVEDTPVEVSVHAKYAGTPTLASVGTEWLVEVANGVDGGIDALRDADGQAALANWGLGWSLSGHPAKATLSITNVSTFRTHFSQPQLRNSSTGLHEDVLRMVATDRMGFETLVEVPLRFSVGSGAVWSSTFVSGNLPGYSQGLTLGYVSDPDGGVPLPPQVLPLTGNASWNDTGLEFSSTGEQAPRQRLRVMSASKFGAFMEQGNGVTKDANKGTAKFSFKVMATDATAQQTELTILLEVKDSVPVPTPGPKLLGTHYLSQLVVGDVLYTVTDVADRGIATLLANGVDSSFSKFGIQLGIASGVATLFLADLLAFQQQLAPTVALNPKTHQLERQLEVAVTDKLGFRAVLILPLAFLNDRAATWTPSAPSVDFRDVVENYVFGRLHDDDQGIQSVAVTGVAGWSSSGLEFVADKSNTLDRVLKVTRLADFQAAFPTLFQFDTQTRKHVLAFTAVVTDKVGGTTDVRMVLQVDELVTDVPPTWRVLHGFEGSKSDSGIARNDLMVEIENDADGGLVHATGLYPSSFTAWGLRLWVDTATGRAYVEVSNVSSFLSQLKVKQFESGADWAFTLRASVQDKKSFSTEVQVPIRVRRDTAPTVTVPTLPMLEACSDGMLLASISDVLDSGIKSHAVVQATGYVEGNAGLVIRRESGEVKVRVGTQAAFMEYVRSHFTLNYSLRTAKYELKVDTEDSFQGKATCTVQLTLGFAKPTVTVTWTELLVAKIAANKTVANLQFSGLYDFASADFTLVPTLFTLGLRAAANGFGAGVIQVADPLALSKAVFEGKLPLELGSNRFFHATSLNVQLSPGQSFSIPSVFALEGGKLALLEYYSQLSQPHLRVEVTEARSLDGTTKVDFDIRTFFASPFGGSFDTSGLVSSRVTYTNPGSNYLFRLVFKEAFFDQHITKEAATVSFTATFQYGSPRQAAIEVKFSFYPKR